MTYDTCKRCGRTIVYAKRHHDHASIALEKIRAFTIDISMIGSTAMPVEPNNGEDLYVAHVAVCPRDRMQNANR